MYIAYARLDFSDVSPVPGVVARQLVSLLPIAIHYFIHFFFVHDSVTHRAPHTHTNLFDIYPYRSEFDIKKTVHTSSAMEMSEMWLLFFPQSD